MPYTGSFNMNKLQYVFVLVFISTMQPSTCRNECGGKYIWPCLNKEFGCIETSRYCNHHVDCEDGSDEELCPHTDCLGEWIKRCKDSSRCIWVGYHCSGYDRCEDGTLDINCGSCRMGGFLCPNSSRCARPEKKCTGYDVCYDGSSDENCTSCAESGFPCLNKRCIRPERLCNGKDECGDGGSSNWNCTTCFGGAVNCSGNPNRCVRSQDYCTGFNVCGDGSTDENCQVCSKGSILYAKAKRCVRPEFFCSGRNESGDGSSDMNCKVCHSDAFHCVNKRCIRPELKCNGEDFCGDGSSNLNCTVCKRNAMLCREDGKCLSTDKVCNGNWDCTNGSDEMHCTKIHSSSHHLHIIYGVFLIVLVLVILGLVAWYNRHHVNTFRWSLKRNMNLLDS